MFTLLFLVTSHNKSPLPTQDLPLSLAGGGIRGGDLGHFRELLSFPGSLPGLLEGHMRLHLFIFLLLICLLLQGDLAKNLEG